MNSKRSCRPRKLSYIGSILALMGFYVAHPSWAQEEDAIWTKLADMPTARQTLNVDVIDGKIYAVGGNGGLKKLEVYDPVTDTWTPKADMATPRAWFGSGVVNGKLYAMGGANALNGVRSNSVEEYDPATDTWTKKGDMPIATYFHTACTVNGKIYVIGGYPTPDIPVSTVYEFDPIADTWTQKANMPAPRGIARIGVVDGKIYVLGGIDSGWTALSRVEMYDPATDTWTRKANMPRGNTASVGVLDGKIYAFGGVLEKGGTGQRTVYRYDVETDAWEKFGDMPVNNTGLATVSLNGSIYVIGGCSGPYPYTSSILKNVWKFTPAPPVDPNDLDGDGIPTDYELANGLNPNVADANTDHDGDGLIAIDEFERGTRADNPDSDGDGVNDGDEVASGTDPLDSESLPGTWPDLIPLNVAGFEPEGIELGKSDDFFVGAFSYSTWFGQPFSAQSGAIYRGNLRTGEGGLLVQPTGTPVKGLSYDARTDYLWVAKGMGAGTQGVIVYDATSGEEIANVTYEGDRTNNDILVTDAYVYCTDSFASVLYRIPLAEGGQLPDPLVVEDFPMNGFLMHSEAGKSNANGLVETADGNLIVVNTSTGGLFHVDSTSGDTTPINITGDESLFVNGDGLYLDDHTLYICQNFSNKIGVVQLSEDFMEGSFARSLTSPDLAVPTTITRNGDSIYAINTHFSEIAAGNHAKVQTEVVRLSADGGDWPELHSLGIAGFEPEGIELGKGHDFFVGAFSYSTWFGAPFSPLSGAIYRGNLRTGEGSLLVEPTGLPIKGLSYDVRTDTLWVAKGMGASPQGIIVYNATSGEEIANLTYEGERTNNDILVTDDYVYCTDSYSPVLYRTPLGEGGQLPETLEVEDLPMNGFVMHPEAGKTNANGLVETADGNLIVVNITTGVLYRVNTATGDTTPIPITGDEPLFADGDGLYLDDHTLYICQNFSNKIGVVRLSENFSEGVFLWDLVSDNLAIPTTITGYGDSIYAINTNFPQIAAGNHGESIPAVVKLPNVGVPSIRVMTITPDEETASLKLGFDTAAPSSLFDIILEQSDDLAGPWNETPAEAQESKGGRYFLIPHNPAWKQAFYRLRLRAK